MDYLIKQITKPQRSVLASSFQSDSPRQYFVIRTSFLI